MPIVTAFKLFLAQELAEILIFVAVFADFLGRFLGMAFVDVADGDELDSRLPLGGHFMMPVPCPPTPIAAIMIWSFGPAFLAFLAGVLRSCCSARTSRAYQSGKPLTVSAARDRSRNPRRDKVPCSSSMCGSPNDVAVHDLALTSSYHRTTRDESGAGAVSLAGSERMRLYCLAMSSGRSSVTAGPMHATRV